MYIQKGRKKKSNICIYRKEERKEERKDDLHEEIGPETNLPLPQVFILIQGDSCYIDPACL